MNMSPPAWLADVLARVLEKSLTAVYAGCLRTSSGFGPTAAPTYPNMKIPPWPCIKVGLILCHLDAEATQWGRAASADCVEDQTIKGGFSPPLACLDACLFPRHHWHEPPCPIQTGQGIHRRALILPHTPSDRRKGL